MPACYIGNRRAVSILAERRGLLAEGKSMKEAAQVLNVRPRTIAFHKYGMMEHLGFKTTSELVRHAVTLGLVGRSRDPS